MRACPSSLGSNAHQRYLPFDQIQEISKPDWEKESSHCHSAEDIRIPLSYTEEKRALPGIGQRVS